MNNFLDKLDHVLSPVADVLSNNKFLRSIANGLIALMPLTMVAAIFQHSGGAAEGGFLLTAVERSGGCRTVGSVQRHLWFNGVDRIVHRRLPAFQKL